MVDRTSTPSSGRPGGSSAGAAPVERVAALTDEPLADAIDVLARTIYGEARGEIMRGKEAIAAVVVNRIAFAKARKGGTYWWGNTFEGVCRKPWQFSCWNENDPNREKLMFVSAENTVFATCLRVATRAVEGAIADPTDGATHYHVKGLTPPWSKGGAPCAEIGNHVFFKDIG